MIPADLLAYRTRWQQSEWKTYTPNMGMFDEIRCEVQLPDDYDPGDDWFQSKSVHDYESRAIG